MAKVFAGLPKRETLPLEAVLLQLGLGPGLKNMSELIEQMLLIHDGFIFRGQPLPDPESMTST